MRLWLMVCVLVGLTASGCYEGPAPKAATDSQSVPSDLHAGVSPLGGAPEAAPGQPLGDSGGPIELQAITLKAPAGWPQVTPSSSFVAAEYTLPRAEGDDADGRLTISTAGGTVEANIERWRGQFDAQAQQRPQEEIDVADMKVTIVDLSGNFSDQRGPFAAAVERSGYRMIAAIVPVENQLHFIKATGPEKTIASHADEIHKFFRTVERKQ